MHALNPRKTPRMMAEWSPQAAIMLAWPHNESDWHPWLNDIWDTYIELTTAISQFEPVLILCKDQHHRESIEKSLPSTKHPVHLVCTPYNDTWCRDYGPIAVATSDHQQLLDFRFNGWGEKYDATLDDQVCLQLKQQHIFPASLTSIPFQLEGGSIETNGKGTLITTEACLLSGTRNKSSHRDEIESSLKEYLGIEQVLWLREGYLCGDDTDSHIDNLVRFSDAKTLLYAAPFAKNDIHYMPLKAMETELIALNDQHNLGYNLIPIQIPEPQLDNVTGKRLPGSYINFLILNDAVIVPVFDVPQDAIALTQIQQAFPDRKIVRVTGSHLIKQYGGPHCATMQLPINTVHLPTDLTINA